MAEEMKVLEVQDKVDASLTKLAVKSVSPEFHYEYLYLVCEIMELYEDFSKAVDDDNHDQIFELADQICNRIELEFDGGFLSI